MSLITPRNRQFIDENGDPIVNGYVYFGTYGTDPKTNLITIYSDEAETIALANPQRTDSYGFIENDVYFTLDYSYLVENSNNVTEEGPKDRRLSSNLSISISDALQIIEATETSSNLYDIDPEWEVLPPAGIYALVFPTVNTGAVTMTIDGVAGTYAVENHNSDPLVAGDIRANVPYLARWTGTEWQILEPYTIRGIGNILGVPTVQKFTTAGSNTYTPTPGKTYARVRGVAGGGGGAAAYTSAQYVGGGGGGGGGIEFLVDLTTVSGTITLVTGAKGDLSATYNGTAATDGGDSSWSDDNNTITLEGGVAGVNATSSENRGPGAGGGVTTSIVDSITVIRELPGEKGGVERNQNVGGASLLGARTAGGLIQADPDEAAESGIGYGSGGGGGGSDSTTDIESGQDGSVGAWIIEEY